MTYDPNPAAGNVSYFYEFSDAPCSWASAIGSANNSATWNQVKFYQMTKKKTDHPAGKFPVIRCFWHLDDWEDYKQDLTPGDNTTGGFKDHLEKVINAGVNGNVFYSAAKWEVRYWTP